MNERNVDKHTDIERKRVKKNTHVDKDDDDEKGKDFCRKAAKNVHTFRTSNIGSIFKMKNFSNKKKI